MADRWLILGSIDFTLYWARVASGSLRTVWAATFFPFYFHRFISFCIRSLSTEVQALKFCPGLQLLKWQIAQQMRGLMLKIYILPQLHPKNCEQIQVNLSTTECIKRQTYEHGLCGQFSACQRHASSKSAHYKLHHQETEKDFLKKKPYLLPVIDGKHRQKSSCFHSRGLLDCKTAFLCG